MRNLTSAQNPTVKFIERLQRKSSERRSQQLCVVEGKKEIMAAVEGGFRLHSLYLCPELAGEQAAPEWAKEAPAFTLTPALFSKLAYRDQHDGLLAIVHTKTWRLGELEFSKPPFLLAVEAVEKPGNLGAILRTADGCGADAVVVLDERCDPYGPNVIRASVGCVFQKPVIVCGSEQFLSFCQAKRIARFAAALTDGAQPYGAQDFRGPSALLLGTEAEGLSDFWLHPEAATPVIIPMHGYNDSLNVSVAAAVLAYEVLRQREAG